MKRIATYSLLLLLGMALAQVLPTLVGAVYHDAMHVVRFLTMVALSYIMLRVGLEFEIKKTKLREYASDYFVAAITATAPWLLVTGYFLWAFADSWAAWDSWKESLLVGRFAAPTSAGILLAMLAAAKLHTTWVYAKARILAIFDDLDTILLMVPLKLLVVGLAWQLGASVLLIALLLACAWVFLHKLNLPSSWRAVLLYSVGITTASELIHWASILVDPSVPLHIEVLLPAFVLGCVIKHPQNNQEATETKPLGDGDGKDETTETRVAGIVTGAFMLFVGLSMPPFLLNGDILSAGSGQQSLSFSDILFHVCVITLLATAGKMFPYWYYRGQRPLRDRVALSIAMVPRGEVGAGILMVAMGFGLGGPMLTVAMLSLAFNLALTGVLIVCVKHLLSPKPTPLFESVTHVVVTPISAFVDWVKRLFSPQHLAFRTVLQAVRLIAGLSPLGRNFGSHATIMQPDGFAAARLRFVLATVLMLLVMAKSTGGGTGPISRERRSRRTTTPECHIEERTQSIQSILRKQ